MDRKTTIKKMRDIIRKLSDEELFLDSDFERDYSNKVSCASRVERYIQNKLLL